MWDISSRIEITVGILIPTDPSCAVLCLDVFAQSKTENVTVSNAAVNIWYIVHHLVENVQHRW